MALDLDKALKNKNSKYDMSLRGSCDNTITPENQPTVTIKGVVFNLN